MNKLPNCPYCNKEAKQITGKEMYPHREDLYDLVFFKCDPCDASVGAHKGSNKPLGNLANRKLRKLRSKVHKAFDPIWRDREMTRRGAYDWLSQSLRIDIKSTHIAMFNEERCIEALALTNNRRMK